MYTVIIRRFARGSAALASSLLAALFFSTSAGAADGTAIGELAESMTPGQWRELVTTGADSAFSADTSIFEYADRMVWDPLGKQALFYGSSDPGGSSNHKFIRYQASTNAWTQLPKPPWSSSYLIMHSYKHQTVDVVNRRLYYRPMGSDNRDFRYVSLDNPSGSWVQRADVDGVEYAQDASALDFFHGRGTIIFHSGAINGTQSGLAEYNPATNTWSSVPGAFSPRGDLHALVECNAVHNFCIFGGGDDTRNVWRINSDRSTTPLTQAPFRDFSTRYADTTVDPVTGDYLVLTRDNEFWQFDARGSGNWTRIASGSQVPAFVGYDDVHSTFHGVATTISSYGVIMYTQWRGSGSKVWLYKHAPIAGDRTPPAAITDLRPQ
jgi:hypothetical protein